MKKNILFFLLAFLICGCTIEGISWKYGDTEENSGKVKKGPKAPSKMDIYLQSAQNRYNLSYLSWDSEHRTYISALKDNTVERDTAFKRILGSLNAMRWYLPDSLHSEIDKIIQRYETNHQNIINYGPSTPFVMELESLEKCVKNTFAPQLVTIINRPETTEEEVTNLPETISEEDEFVDFSKEPLWKQAISAPLEQYIVKFNEWKKNHKDFEGALKEGKNIDENCNNVCKSIESMSSLLVESVAKKLIVYKQEYSDISESHKKGVDIKLLLDKLKICKNDIEKKFPPEKISKFLSYKKEEKK